MMRRSLANLGGVASVGGRRDQRLGAGLGVVIGDRRGMSFGRNFDRGHARYARQAFFDDGTAGDARHVLDGERSEEHTSELQSLMRISYAVFCLKKKNYHTTRAIDTNHTQTT